MLTPDRIDFVTNIILHWTLVFVVWFFLRRQRTKMSIHFTYLFSNYSTQYDADDNDDEK